MPVQNEEKKKVGRPPKKTSAPKTTPPSSKPIAAPSKKETVALDPFAVLIIKWIGRGDPDRGLNKVLNRLIAIPGEIDKLRDEK